MAGRGRNLAVAGVAGLGIFAAYRGTRGSRRRPIRIPGRTRPRIVILGAGFAGLAAAKGLVRRLGDRGNILLIDRRNYQLFTPLLFQVTSADIHPYDVTYPIRNFTGSHGVDFQMGTVTGVDFEARRVLLADDEVPYDYLVIALGSTTNFLGNASAREQALPLKSLENAVAIRHRVLDILELATRASDPDQRRPMLSFVVVGGGATGAETAASLRDMLNRTGRPNYPSVNFDEARVIVVEAANKLLGQMGERISSAALRELRAAGVEVLLNAPAQEVTPDSLIIRDGTRIPTRTVIWATGVQSPRAVASLDAPHGKGGSLEVDQYLQVKGLQGVYAAGDNSHTVERDTGKPVPLLAQIAVQQGEAVAKNLVRAMTGQPQHPFRHRLLGNTLWLGKVNGVAEIDGLILSGIAGNLGWRAVHLAKLPGVRNRLSTLLDWSSASLYKQHTIRLELEPGAGVDEESPEMERRAARPSRPGRKAA